VTSLLKGQISLRCVSVRFTKEQRPLIYEKTVFVTVYVIQLQTMFFGRANRPTSRLENFRLYSTYRGNQCLNLK
jgi:hypothetical protein